MLATKILMKASCAYSNNLQEIDQIYVDGCNNPGFFKKEFLHDYVKAHPKSIQVNIRPFPYLVARTSKNGENTLLRSLMILRMTIFSNYRDTKGGISHG